MKKSMYIKFGLDIIMAVIFVLLFNKRVLGGLAFHEIAGLAMAVIFFTHILLNWKWVKNVTWKLFDKKLAFKIKIGYLLNVLLLISMTFIIISGILVSKVVFPNIEIANEQWFKISHITISFIVLILVGAHVGLHWKWVVNVFKNIFSVKAPKRVFGILAKVAAVAFLVFGGYQMVSTNFIMHLQGVPSVFGFSSAQSEESFGGGEGHFAEHNFRGGGFGDEDHFEGLNHPDGDQAFRGGQFEERHFPDGDGGFRGKDGHFGSVNPLGVIVTYSSIISVFIIIIYYLDKLIVKKRRRTAV